MYCVMTMNAGGDDLDAYLTRRMEDSADQELDVYTQLANKEKDLLLAAELGKALLEKNEELERVNAQIHEDYQTKLEELEQEKHDLRFRLENAERQYEVMLKELQADITMYRQQVENKESSMKIEERERYQVVTELTKQNERITEQIKKSEEAVKELTQQNHSLREQLRNRQSSTRVDYAQQELLREEISYLTDKQCEAERVIGQLEEERDALTLSLDESQERIHMLEKQKREQENELRGKDQQILELKDTNVLLEERLEDVCLQVSSGDFSHNNSLFSELEMSSDNIDQLGRSTENLRTLRHPLSPHVSLHELNDDDIECDDDVTDVAMVTTSSLHDYSEGVLEPSHSVDVRHEYIESYKLVRSLIRKLRPSNVPSLPSPSDDPAQSDLEAGLLNMLQDLRELVEEMYHKARSQYDESYVRELDERIQELSVDLSASRNQLETLRVSVRDKDCELSQTGKQIDELTRKLSLQKLTLQHQEMMRIQKERDEYTDQVSHDKPETALQQARKDRDQAINRRNNMELELTKAQVELASTERQLMEAIHQKIAICEQLEQCQMDFESVLDFQMQKRFNTEVTLSPKRKQKEDESPGKKLFGFLS